MRDIEIMDNLDEMIVDTDKIVVLLNDLEQDYSDINVENATEKARLLELYERCMSMKLFMIEDYVNKINTTLKKVAKEL